MPAAGGKWLNFNAIQTRQASPRTERYLLASLEMTFERETFGRILRAARERRGVTLEELEAVTKVATELWQDLEDNDFSRWPARLYARTYVRQYAAYIGLDGEEVSSEFCRLFPDRGDRRAESLVRDYAAIVAHEIEWRDPTATAQNRRATDPKRPKPGLLGRNFDLILAVGFDLAVPVSLALAPRFFFKLPFWPAVAVTMAVYHSTGLMAFGHTPGTVLSGRCMRLFRAIPVTRHLVSSRVETS